MATATWMVGAFGKCAAGGHTFLGAGEVDEVVDRGPRITHRRRRDAGGKESERWEPVQRTVDHRAIEDREHPLVGNEDLLGDGVVAAGAAQAEGVPGVQDLQLLGG